MNVYGGVPFGALMRLGRHANGNGDDEGEKAQHGSWMRSLDAARYGRPSGGGDEPLDAAFEADIQSVIRPQLSRVEEATVADRLREMRGLTSSTDDTQDYLTGSSESAGSAVGVGGLVAVGNDLSTAGDATHEERWARHNAMMMQHRARNGLQQGQQQQRQQQQHAPRPSRTVHISSAGPCAALFATLVPDDGQGTTPRRTGAVLEALTRTRDFDVAGVVSSSGVLTTPITGVETPYYYPPPPTGPTSADDVSSRRQLSPDRPLFSPTPARGAAEIRKVGALIPTARRSGPTSPRLATPQAPPPVNRNDGAWLLTAPELDFLSGKIEPDQIDPAQVEQEQLAMASDLAQAWRLESEGQSGLRWLGAPRRPSRVLSRDFAPNQWDSITATVEASRANEERTRAKSVAAASNVVLKERKSWLAPTPFSQVVDVLSGPRPAWHARLEPAQDIDRLAAAVMMTAGGDGGGDGGGPNIGVDADEEEDEGLTVAALAFNDAFRKQRDAAREKENRTRVEAAEGRRVGDHYALHLVGRNAAAGVAKISGQRPLQEPPSAASMICAERPELAPVMRSLPPEVLRSVDWRLLLPGHSRRQRDIDVGGKGPATAATAPWRHGPFAEGPSAILGVTGADAVRRQTEATYFKQMHPTADGAADEDLIDAWVGRAAVMSPASQAAAGLPRVNLDTLGRTQPPAAATARSTATPGRSRASSQAAMVMSPFAPRQRAVSIVDSGR